MEDAQDEEEEALTASSSTGAADAETSSSVSNMVMDLNSEALTETDEEGEVDAEALTASSSSVPATTTAAVESAPAEESAPAAESAPAEESAPAAESAPAEESAPAAESAPAEESAPAAESAPAEEESKSNNANFFEESASNEVTSSGLVADNVRMALYGMTELTSDHISEWETLTASYFEEFYNDYTGTSDSTRAAVSDVEAWFEFTSLNLASSRRMLHVRRRLQGSAHLITYTQRTRYTSDDDVTLGDVLQGPFSDPTKRADYITYLQENSELFSDLQGVSTVFLPVDMPQYSPAAATPTESASESNSAPSADSSPEPKPEASPNSSASPFDEEDEIYTSNQSTQPQEHSPDCTEGNYEGFFCHNSGEPCPCGTCADNDACFFVGDGTTVDVGSYIVQNSNAVNNSPEHAAEFVQAALNGNFAATFSTTTSSTGSDESDPLPYSSAEYGPTTVHGTMTLTGMNMIEVDSIYEWQYMTAVFEQNFYNLGEPIGDAVKDAIHNFATILEVEELSYGNDSNGTPTTIIKFKQVFKYDSPDSMISSSTIATRPFLNQEDRDAYIAYLKEMLPSTFGSLESSSGEDATEESEEGDPNEALNFLVKLTETFYCSESWPVDCATAQSCKSGDSCPEGQTCFTAPMCAAGEQYSAPVASDDSDRPSSSFGDHIAGNGPSHINGVMTLTGMTMVEVDNIHEWEDLTAIFEHEFYNKGEDTIDYVQNAVHNFATALEIIDLSYGDDNDIPTTIIQFKQSIKYDTSDPDLPVSAIVTQPFLTPEYRESYINYLKEMLPNSFGSLSTSSSVPDSDVKESSDENEVLNFLVKLKETFFCSPSWPVDCSTATRCESGEGCGEGEKCYTAPMCATEAVQNSIAQGIQDESSTSTSTTAAPETTSAASETTSVAPGETTPPPPELSLGDMEFNSAAFESDGGEDEQQEEESKEMPTHSEQFYCGRSWIDASDRCQTPCPDNDASVCGEGESCFSSTSCQQNESFFCGESFEHASTTCSTPCSGLNVFECPSGQGCFQYTTCNAVDETARDSFYCGTSWRNAAETCGTPCSGGSSDECGEGQFCFSHTGCDHTDDISLGAFGDLGGFVGSDSQQQQQPSWMAGYWETKSISSSSSRTRALSLLLSSMLALLYVGM